MKIFSNAGIKQKFFIMFFPIFLIITVAIAYSYYSISIDKIKETETKHLQSKTEEFYDLVKSSQDNLLLLVSFISNMDEIKSAYLNPDKEAGYQSLKSTVLPIINSLGFDTKKFQLHFHRPPAISFYRVFSNKRNDDLSKFRHTILKTYETKKPVLGLEHGAFNFGIRAITPIFDKEKNYIGSVEFIRDLPEILATMNEGKADKVDMLTIVDYNYISNFISSEYVEKNYPIKIGNFRSAKSEINKLNMEKLIDESDIKSLVSSNTKLFDLRDNNLIALVPIVDFKGEIPGVFFFSIDVTNKINEAFRNIVYIVVLIIVFAVIVFWIISIMFDKILIKPINNVIRVANKVADGDF